jgi:glycosyltransferase involved in cell wall biosynthesis
MTEPLISVVMPVFNGAAYLREAIESILCQSLDAFELIVVDDGSSDATAEIARASGDPRLRLVQNPANLGVASSRNIALALATGRYVALMDGDDIAAPQRLELQVDLLDRHAELEICGSDVEMFGDRTGKSDLPAADADIKARLLFGNGSIVNPTAMVRREFAVRHALRYRADYVAGSDLAFWADCMRAGARFANIKQDLVRYRWHGRNLSGRAAAVIPAETRIRRDLVQDFFPALTGAEAEALAAMFGRRPLTFDVACAAVAAGRQAQADMVSRFGENRALLRSIIEERIGGVRQALRTRPSPAPLAAGGR